jgi:hypothetical protein
MLTRSRGRTLLQFALGVVVAVLLLLLLARAQGVSFANRDLIDSDGYMRFLRVRDLMEGGSWFSSASMRSNAPYGETLHWTRPLDVIVVLVYLIIVPVVSSDALYWAAVATGPLLLAGLAGAIYWAYSLIFTPAERPLLFFGVLGAPMALAYAVPGRLDHHILLMLLLALAVGFTLRVIQNTESRDAIGLGICLAVGLWVAVEFVVPVVLVAATLIGLFAASGSDRYLQAMARSYTAATIIAVVCLALERGAALGTVQYSRLSIAHISVLLGGAAAAWFLNQPGTSARSMGRRLGMVFVVGLTLAATVVVMFPGWLRGPFGDFHPLVVSRWLTNVVELLPLLDPQLRSSVLPIVLPVAVGLLGGLVAALARRPLLPATMGLVLGIWCAAYLGLSLWQVRWLMFAQILAVPFWIALVARTAQTDGSWLLRLTRLTAAAFLVVGIGMGGFVVGSRLDASPDQVGRNCVLSDVVPTLRTLPETVILADQDVGPELLYRTPHSVVATPYGNEEGLLYLFEVMAESNPQVTRELLAMRGVGFILICPGPQNLTYPETPKDSFYESLVIGPRPEFIRPVSLPEDSDYLLFAVED